MALFIGFFLLLPLTALSESVVFVADEEAGQVFSAAPDGGDMRLIAFSFASASSLAVDSAGGKIYWADSAAGDIKRSDLDGSGAEIIISGLQNPRGLDVDPAGGRIYWAAGASTIQSADLDGDNLAILAISGSTSISQLRVDAANSKLFWTDKGGGAVKRSNLDGSSPEDVLTGLDSPSGLDIDETAGKLYFSNTSGTINIVRANLDGSDLEVVNNFNVDGPEDVAVDAAGGKVYWLNTADNVLLRDNLAGGDPELIASVGGGAGIGLDTLAGELYFISTSRNALRKAKFNGTELQDVRVGTGSSPYDVDVDVSAGKVYWTDTAADRIYRADMNGGNAETLVAGLGFPGSIALDPAAGKMYWTESVDDKIQRANLDGSSIEDLVTTGLASPGGLSLDIAGGRMYWVDGANGGVYRANLDGSNVETLISSGLSIAAGLELDVPNGKMYITDTQANNVLRADLDGSNLTTLAMLQEAATGISIDRRSNRLFWVLNPSFAAPGARSANIDGSNVSVFSVPVIGPRGITVAELPLTTNSAASTRFFWSDIFAREISAGDAEGRRETLVFGLQTTQYLALDSINGKLYWSDIDSRRLRRSDVDGGNTETLLVDAPGITGVEVDAEGGYIYYADDSSNLIGRLNLDGSQPATVIDSGLSSPQGLAIDFLSDKLYWADSGSNKIQRSDLDGSSVEDVVTGLTTPLGVAVDAANGKVYWTDSGTGKVQRANLDGTSIEDLLTGLGNPAEISVDSAGGKIYWTSQSSDKVQRSNLDGSSVEDLVATGINQPFGMALDPGNGKLYFSEVVIDRIQQSNLDGSSLTAVVDSALSLVSGVDSDASTQTLYFADRGQNRIFKSGFDGSNIAEVITINSSVNGIAVDALGGKIYWADAAAQSIRRANLDGTSEEQIITGQSAPFGVDIDPIHGKVYWTDTGLQKLQRANLDGSSPETVSEGGFNTFGVAVDPLGGKVYWSEDTLPRIRRADLDGANAEDIITGLSTTYGISLDLSEQKIYWAERVDDKIRRADFDGSSVEDVITTGLITAEHISVLDTAPSVEISGPLGITPLSPVPLVITFSENVSGFQQSDIIPSSGSISKFSGSGRSYTAEIEVASFNTLIHVDINAGAATDSAGFGSTAAKQYSVAASMDRPSAAITGAPPSFTNANTFSATISFSEAVSGFSLSDINVENGTASRIQFISASQFTADITPDLSGDATLLIAADSAFNAGSSGNSTSNTVNIENKAVDTDGDGIVDLIDPDDDNDGLSDVEENSLGTDSKDPDSDDDGLNDGTEVNFTGTDPKDADSDDDSVNDGMEISDGTNPLDPGSVQERFGSEICVEWNGFVNFLTQIFELRNTSSTTLGLEVTLYDILGGPQEMLGFTLAPGIQRDIIINDLRGFIANSYGLVCAKITSGPADSLGGQLVTYRLTGATYTLAFVSEFLPARSGNQYFTYNTFQPSLDPFDSSNFVANWVQLVNNEASGQSGTLRYYDFEGNEVRTEQVVFGPRERRDIDIHTLGASLSGLVCWEPDSSTAKFRMRQNRYYYGPTGLADLVEAASLPAKRGTGEKLLAPFDTRNRTVALEISNTTALAITITTTVRNAAGALTSSQPPLLGIPARGTRGIVLNEYLASGLGNMQIDSSAPGSMIVNIVEYGRASDGSLLYANPSSPLEPLGSDIRGSYNSFLGQACRMRAASSSISAETAQVTMTRFDGTPLIRSQTINLPANGAVEMDLCSAETEQAYGEVRLEASSSGVHAAEVIRRNAEGTIEFGGPLKP